MSSKKSQEIDILRFEEKLSKSLLSWGIMGFISVLFTMNGTNLIARGLDSWLKIIIMDGWELSGFRIFSICIAIICMIVSGLFAFFYYRFIKILNSEPGQLSIKNHTIMMFLTKIHFIGIIVLNALQGIYALTILSVNSANSYSYNYVYSTLITIIWSYEIVVMILGGLLLLIWIVWNFYFKSWITGIYQARQRPNDQNFFNSFLTSMLIGSFMGMIMPWSNSFIYFTSIIFIAIYFKKNKKQKPIFKNSKPVKKEIASEPKKKMKEILFCYNCGQKIEETDIEQCPNCNKPF